MKDKERQLLEKAQQGSSYAFGKLVKLYQDKVLFLAYDIIGNYDDAQDIAQNAFLKAFKHIKTFRGQSSFSTWIYRIVVNLTIDYKRAEARKKYYSIDKTTDDSFLTLKDILNEKDKRPDELLELKDFDDHVKRVVDTLPHHQKVAFVLRHYHDMPMDEISKIFECKPGTVRSHLFRAISKLREELKEFDES